MYVTLARNLNNASAFFYFAIYILLLLSSFMKVPTTILQLNSVTHQVTHQVRSHLDPDNPAPVDDLEGYQTLVQKETHPCAVNLL